MVTECAPLMHKRDAFYPTALINQSNGTETNRVTRSGANGPSINPLVSNEWMGDKDIVSYKEMRRGEEVLEKRYCHHQQQLIVIEFWVDKETG